MQCMLPLFMTCLAASALSLPAAAAVAMATDEEQDQQRHFITDVFSHRGTYRQQIDLSGPWSFRRDPDDQGHVSGWHRGEGEFTDTVMIPGPPQAQGFGDPHVYQRTAFAGPFWLRRTFDVPRLCQNHRLWLRLGGVLPAAEIYVNGKSVGFTKSSRTQQRVDITGFVKDGAENGITIKVCDFPEVRLDGLLEWNEGTQLWRGIGLGSDWRRRAPRGLDSSARTARRGTDPSG